MKHSFKHLLLNSLFLGLVFSSGSALAEGNFVSSCNNLTLDIPTLSASCRSINHDVNRTSINLDGYIINSNGHLIWQRNGRFAKTVKNCYLWKSTLNCQARSAGGQWLHSELNLNSRIENNNGNLIYDGP